MRHLKFISLKSAETYEIQMLEAKEPDPTVEARRLYECENYEASKKKLQEIKRSNESIELNVLLTEYKINPGNGDMVLKALMDALTKINIDLFNQMGAMLRGDRPSSANPIKFISHEFYYWNIVAISQQIGKPSVATLVAQEAVHFYSSFRTETALMVLGTLGRQALAENKLSSCCSALTKFKEAVQRASKLSPESRLHAAFLRFTWIRALLRFGLYEEAREMLQSKKTDEQKQLFDDFPQRVLPLLIYKQFLSVEIECFKGNLKVSLQKLGELISTIENCSGIGSQEKERVKHFAESNIAAVLILMGKSAISTKMLLKNGEFFRKSCHTDIDNDRFTNFERSKQLLLYSYLKTDERLFNVKQYRKLYESLQHVDSGSSYKFFYRKGQFAVNMFHKVIKESENLMPYKSIADDFQCCYYYPNDPYFQSKGKNKNPFHSQGKRFYRRYQLSEWDAKGVEESRNEIQLQRSEESTVLHVKVAEQQEPKTTQKLEVPPKGKEYIDKHGKKKRKNSSFKDESRKYSRDEDSENERKETKSEFKEKQQSGEPKDPHSTEQLSSIVFTAIGYFKQALSLLEEERNIGFSFGAQESQKDFTQHSNTILEEEYRAFKESILSSLCYLYLCRNEWAKVIEYSELYKRFVSYERKAIKYEQMGKASRHNQYYSVMTYQMEAYCQQNKFSRAYETMNELIQEGYSEAVCFEVSSSINHNPRECKVEQSNQYQNLLYNMAVLHARDNHLPEAHQSLQKILSEGNLLPNKYSMKTPLSINDLLLHYHIRTSDRMSALEILKRRRVMGMGGVSGVYSTLKVTK